MIETKSPAWISAALSCGLILAQTGYHLVKMVSFSAQDFDAATLFEILAEVMIAVIVLALPAALIFRSSSFGVWVERTAFLYPMFLAFGFWQANIIGDGMAYMFVFVFLLMPACVTYAGLLVVYRRFQKL